MFRSCFVIKLNTLNKEAHIKGLIGAKFYGLVFAMTSEVYCKKSMVFFQTLSKLLCNGNVILKATSHSTIFNIPMRPLREDQEHRYRFTR